MTTKNPTDTIMTKIHHPITLDCSTVLCELFSFLDRRGIDYVVVSDSREYPQHISSDIDIVVDSKQLSSFHKELFDYLTNFHGLMVQCIDHEQTARYFTIAWRDQGNCLHFLNPDICSDYFRFGRLFLSADELLEGRRLATDRKGNVKGFYVPTPALGFIYYLLKKIDKGSLDGRQGDYLSQEWKKDPYNSSNQVKRFWNESDATLIIDAATTNDWEAVRVKLPELRTALDSNLAFSLTSRVLEFIRKMKRIIHPTGLFVVFLGADGSGKSTLIAQVRQTLLPSFRHTFQYHLRPKFGVQSLNAVPVTDPHAAPPRSSIASMAKLIIWWIDYVSGFASNIYIKLIRSTLVIFDRYYYDLLVDPKRYRYGGPKSLPRFVAKLIPQPDLTILLDAPVDVLRSRKQEVAYDEIIRQRKDYLELLKTIPNGHVVDASKSTEDVVTDVENIILLYMATRTANRLAAKRHL